MNASPSIPNGPDGLVQALIESLRQEEAELRKLEAQFGRQLEALREQQPEQQEHAMHEASGTVGTLDRLRTRRERQMRLLGRVLKIEGEETPLRQFAAAIDSHPEAGPLGADLLEARAAVREQAKKTRQICEHLDFALQYAVGLGRDMLQAMQDLDRPPPPCVYTARGNTSRAPTPRSFVNKIG
ncbi:MAG: flagellar export chaperone FlgN [Bacteroidetes bacterium]|nr:flagellar export chaperone FlgN [Bacteroidota bacterium]